MSNYNSALDRDASGRLKRGYRRPPFPMSTPGWWVRKQMNRPRRYVHHRLCRLALLGHDHDAIVWPPGNHKPHKYFW